MDYHLSVLNMQSNISKLLHMFPDQFLPPYFPDLSFSLSILEDSYYSFSNFWRSKTPLNLVSNHSRIDSGGICFNHTILKAKHEITGKTNIQHLTKMENAWTDHSVGWHSSASVILYNFS